MWGGNETWLVLGDAGLLAGFPMADAVMLPALYLPLILMLLVKTEGTLLDWVYALAPKAFLVVLAGITVVSLWTPS